MAKGKGNKKASARSGKDSERFHQISQSTSQIVKDAAALLDEEVAAGIVAARKVQQRFQKEQRIDSADFQEALHKFQGDAHQVVGMLTTQFDQLRSKENSELIKRLVSNTHDVVDLAVEMVNMGAEIAGQLAQVTLKKGNLETRGKRSR